MASIESEDRERLARAARALPRVELAVLFGSAASGRAHATSDVDIAVFAPGSTVDERRDIDVALMRCSTRPVDVIFLNDAPPLLRFEVARDGHLIFERTAGSWVRERARAMIDWWDWAPIARRMGRAAIARLRKEAG